MINVLNIIKSINNISFQVKTGEIFGLLGPNGAGKSTFINILAGTVSKTNGYVNVWGFNLDKNPSFFHNELSVIGDIRKSEEIIFPKNTNCVILLAAEHKDDVSPTSLYYDVNVKGTKNVLKKII